MTKKSDPYSKNASLLKETNNFFAAKQRAALKEYRQLYRVIGKDIGVKFLTTTYVKKPAGHTKKLIQKIVTELAGENASLTQKKILEIIQPHFGEEKLYPNIWQKKLEPWAINLVKSTLGDETNITGCKTLSDIKKRMIEKLGSQTGSKTYKVTITITRKVITVGKKLYPVTVRGTGKYKYPCIRVTFGNKRHWLPIATLGGLVKPDK